MDIAVSDEEYAVKYLLGELTEAEQTRLEEQFFLDTQLSELLSEAEDDLIDRYVRGELSGSERERFENHFLISERRRDKLDVARALLLSERGRTLSTVTRDREAASWRKALASLLSPPRRALSYGVAALVLLTLLGGWLAFEVRQRQRGIAETNAARAQRELQDEQSRQQTEEQRRRSDELSAQNNTPDHQSSQQQVEPANREPRATPALLTFVLSPGDRGSEGPKRLVIPRGVLTVRLQLNLNPGDDYSSYRVNLRRSSGEPIRGWRELRARTTSGERAVVLTVPAALLSEGQYELTLSGATASGAIEDLGYYYFRLQTD